MPREAIRQILAAGETLALNALWQERSLTTEDAAYLTQKSDAEARAVLSRLVDIGLAKPRGERNGRTWHLSAATYRRLGQPAAYIRQRGFEPIQREQMVLQYVERHGRITRRCANSARFRQRDYWAGLSRTAAWSAMAREGEPTMSGRHNL